MLSRNIPSLNGSKGATRSSTYKNLDSVYSSLVAIVNIMALPGSEAFLAALQQSYQRFHYMASLDPESTIKEAKRVRTSYLEWIRGGPVPAPLPPAEHPLEAFARQIESSPLETISVPDELRGSHLVPELSFKLEESILNVLYIESIVEFRLHMIKSGRLAALERFDIVTVGFLDLYRVISIPAAKNFSTIESKLTGEYAKAFHAPNKDGKVSITGNMKAVGEHGITTNLVRALGNLNVTKESFVSAYRENCSTQSHVIMSSSGPNGPATWSAFSDARAVLSSPKTMKPFYLFAEASRLLRFVGGMMGCVQLRATDVVANTALKLGKILTFDEWGGKTRNVAMVDYWTQLILTPLHNTLFEILKGIPSDATFDQSAAVEKVRVWTLDPKAELYSFDLTAATDRLPVSYQARILNAIGPTEDFGRHWALLLVARAYHDMDDVPRHYRAGAPMGSKSNWAMLALTHHVIVQLAAINANLTSFTDYVICGDDIVINSTAVAEKYKVIMNYLGLTINEAKSLIHSAGRVPAAEFCKRVMIKGVEYTALPTKLIAKTVMNGRLLPQLQNELMTRGFKIDDTQLLTWFSALVDSQSVSFVAMLNMMPKEITGLRTTLMVPTEAQRPAKWFEGHPLSENDLVQAYTYTATVEQLKRLDALMRQTKVVAEEINRMTALNQRNVTMLDIPEADGAEYTELYKKLRAYGGDLSYSHPIFEAAQNESIRISLLLSKISSARMGVESAARARILDSFRNALASMWEDVDAARAQADRTLLTRSLDVIETMIESTEVERRAKPDATYVPAMFSTKLQWFEKLWNVRWVLGEAVTVNTARSRVRTSHIEATTVMTEAISRLPTSRKNRI